MSRNSGRDDKRQKNLDDKKTDEEPQEKSGNGNVFPQSVQEMLSVEQPYVSEGTIRPDPERPNTYIIEGNLLLPPNRKFRGHWTLRMTPSGAGAEVSTKTNVAFKIESVDQGETHLSPAKVEELPEKAASDQAHEALRAIKVAEGILESIQIPIKRIVTKESVEATEDTDFLPNVSSVNDGSNINRESEEKVSGQPLSTGLLSLPTKEDHQSKADSNLPSSVGSASSTPESPGWPEKRKLAFTTTTSTSSSYADDDDSTSSASTTTTADKESPGWPEKRRLTYNENDSDDYTDSDSNSRSYSDLIEADPLSTIFEESTQTASPAEPQPPATAQNRRSRSRQRRAPTDDDRWRGGNFRENGDQSPPSGDRFENQDGRQGASTSYSNKLAESERRTSNRDLNQDRQLKVAPSPPPIEPATPEPTTTAKAGTSKPGRRRIIQNSDENDPDLADEKIGRKVDEAIDQGRITTRRRRIIVETPAAPKKAVVRRPRQTLSQKSGLIFPVNHFAQRLLDEGYSSTPQRKDMKILLTATIEYLVRDLLTSSVERTLSQDKKRITAPIVEETIKRDKNLHKLLNNVILPKNPPPYRSKKG